MRHPILIERYRIRVSALDLGRRINRTVQSIGNLHKIWSLDLGSDDGMGES
jgi:hypothetical protein